MQRVFFWTASCSGILLSLLTLLGLLGRYYWLFDLSSHFVLQYSSGLSVCILGMLLASKPRWVLALLPALLMNLYWLLPFLIPANAGSHAETLKVLALNVYVSNQQQEKVLGYLQSEDADVVFLSEVKPQLMQILQEDYPYVLDYSSGGTLGLAFLSKIPFENAESIELSNRRKKILKVNLTWQDRELIFYGMHPFPPLGRRWAASRDAELEFITELLGRDTEDTVLLGDFNASPWSFPMHQLTSKAVLQHASEGYGILPTWRYGSLLLSAPIDHIFLGQDLQAVSYKVDEDVGSDHFPIVTELVLKQN